MNKLFVLESECKITTFLLTGKGLSLIFALRLRILCKDVKKSSFNFVLCGLCITFAEG